MGYERRGHHIIHHNREWSLRPEGAKIRESPQLIVPIERDLHDEIHANCPAIPLLGYQALVRTNNAFVRVRGDTLATMDNLMIAIEKSAEHPKAHAIERSLAQLAIYAIDLQRPYIREAVSYNTQRSVA